MTGKDVCFYAPRPACFSGYNFLNFNRFYTVLLPNGNLLGVSAMYNYDPYNGGWGYQR